jgi:hypothetical protein
VTLHAVAGTPETLNRIAPDWQRWSLTSWRQASIAYATAIHTGAQLFELAALSARYGAQTLAAAAELLVEVDSPVSDVAGERPTLAAVPDRPAPDAPPVPRWDELTLGSIRAQLRRWDSDTLSALYAYELAHGNRPAVVSMLAKRLEKTRPTED